MAVQSTRRPLDGLGANGGIADYLRDELTAPRALKGVFKYQVFLIANLLTGLAFLLFRNPGSPASWGLVPADDTWNALVYARNFADTLTFSYNAGLPEAGMASPLWVVLLSMISWMLSPLGLGLPELAQLTGIALGVAVSALVYHIVRHLTDMPKAAIIAGILVAFDPTFAFARVAGSEAVLFSALSLGVAWAMLRGRFTAASILLALAVVSRPEGFLLLIAAGFAMVARWLWEFDRTSPYAFDAWKDTALLLTPGLLTGLAWVAYNVSVTGTPFPNSFYLGREDDMLYDAQKLFAIWDGYLSKLSYLNGLHFVATLCVLATGSYYALKRGGFAALPLVIVLPLYAYAYSVFLAPPAGEWSFAYRRYLDPMVPYLVLLLVVGMALAWQASDAYVRSRKGLDDETRSQIKGTLVVGVAILAILPLLGMPFRWAKLLPEYSWNVRNVAEVSIPIANWIDSNLPPEAKVATLTPGAVAYFSDRQFVDITGLNSHENIGRGIFDSLSSAGVEYVVAYDNLYVKSWPQTAEIASIRTENNTILDGSRLVVFRTQDKSALTTKDMVQNISQERLTLIDSLDVGDAAQEVDHDWEMNPRVQTVTRTFRTNANVIVQDDANVTSGYESFRVNTVADKDLIIVKRYDAAIRGAVRVYINGQQVGIWRFPPRDYFFGEDQFVIPASFVTGSTALLRFEHLPDPEGLTSLNSFYYWIFVQE